MERTRYSAMGSDIAIVGMACRFPGARNYEQFWDNLKEGRSSIQEIPKERWDWQAYWGDPQKERNKSNSKWGGFIQDADAFDPGFFGLSAREAEATDPQQRIMLELTWSCLEDAGIRPSRISGNKVGVYIGVFNFDYKGLQESKERTIETYHSIGTASAVIANRISHYYNFKGPSFPIDTACSSSFNAIHSAAQSLLLGECEMALAGGISLILTPSRHISFSKAGMLSPTGSCKTFDDSADGYVRSEGAGIVLLKPLHKAIEDGDSIWGILKGSAVNHNGKTHTLTYPNPDAQADVIAEAHRRAGIPVESVSYIEAHGTGTPKGDPMEFQGLVKAFRMLESERRNTNYCGLGSVKTNIGHLESAAGIAGLIKVLLSMRHKQLPALHHFRKLNHRIAIEESPFYIVDKLRDWERPQTEDNQSYPRRAGISSFGFGGTNAHVVVEEAPDSEQAPGPGLPGYLVCLSAKTKEALRQRMLELEIWLDRNGQDCGLGYISATLLLGREHFGRRAAFVVKDMQELREKLAQVRDKGEAAGYFQEHKPIQGEKERPLFDQLGKLLINELRGNKRIDDKEYADKLMALAAIYVKGHEAEWEALFPHGRAGHVHLPTYPFARERYWISEEEEEGTYSDLPAERISAASIHPLLHRNTSDFTEQRFSSAFTGREFFLADHVVQGRRLLPGVAYLEMARIAVEKASGYSDNENTAIRLKNFVWARPIAVGERAVQVHIGLVPAEDGEIFYDIYGKSEESDAEPTVHCQGTAVLRPVGDAPKLNMQDVKSLCAESRFPAAQYYEAFRAMGLNYGPSLRGIEEVFAGAGRVLAKLGLPSPVRASGETFMLHPSLMDSALQAAIILLSGLGMAETLAGAEGRAPAPLFLPFALEELDMFQPSAEAAWALVQRHGDGNDGGGGAKVDIDLMDDQGAICVRMKGLSWRAVDDAALPNPRADAGAFMLEPSWKVREAAPKAVLPAYDEHLIVLCGMGEAAGESLERLMEGARIVRLQSGNDDIGERFQAIAARVFEEIRGLLTDSTKTSVLIQIVIPAREELALMSGLSGLLRTARLEHPKFTGQMIEVEPGEAPERLCEILQENSGCSEDDRVRYGDGKRQVISWDEWGHSGPGETTPWKDGGVYLIAGGAGGLGLLFANEIAGRSKDVSLILVGRSPFEADADRQSKLEQLQRLGARAEYRQADITNGKEVHDLIQNITAEYGGLNGIVHSAGVLRDSLLLRKTAEELKEVLAPKVAGTINLDRASKDIGLDFFLLFSSIFGPMGNPGQADYCAANAFMDAYAEYRSALARSNRRTGRTLSVNWPLWKDGGMRVDAETEKRMLHHLGMAAMDASAGMDALYRAWASGKDQMLVAAGNPELFRARLTSQRPVLKSANGARSAAETEPSPEAASTAGSIAGALEERAVNYLKKLISGVLKLPVQRIDADAPMENYGIDSIMTTQLTSELEKTFGSLSKTLFFEYHNIRDLTGYFLNAYHGKMTELLGAEEKAGFPAPHALPSAAEAKPSVAAPAGRRRSRFAPATLQVREEKAAHPLDVAIIGISGRYPGAGSVQELWDVLRNGKDCITEIPGDRWDHSLYYDADRNKQGKAYGKWGGFLDGVDRFDPLFFNISPREAEMMDPQERLFLQCVYESIEDAGYTRETLASNRQYGLTGQVGVYVGVMYEEYQLYGAQQQMLGNPVALYGLPASVANRVSYFCNFHGPSMTVDTMCSSSLTAIHLACHSLLRGECEVAVAGGVNVSIHPNKYLFLSQGKFISGKGRCESFGEGGDGYVPGEGVGAVLLKPLYRAIADRDNIYGIIKASAVNHGGKTNGYTVPNPNAQASVISRAYREAGINPRAISYLEAHGTGTSLGDPIELAGLSQTFQQFTGDKQFCPIGSVKSNIGHCESAAGIAGLTKVLLQLKYKQLAPSLHSEVLNPNIDFANTPFVVQQHLAEWKRPVLETDGAVKEYPRIAGISSFGAGGSNAHMVIEEYIPQDAGVAPIAAVNAQDPAIVVLSAKTENQLLEQTQRLLAAIDDGQFDDSSLIDAAYTLQLGREAMEERLAAIVTSVRELEKLLKSFVHDREQAEGVYYGQVKRNKDAMSVFSRDEELEEAVAKWIQRKKYAKLVSLWVKGLHVDWSKLYGDIKPRRISLPSYPFAKERYWVPGLDAPHDGIALRTGKEGSLLASRERPMRRETSFLTKRWEPSGTALAKTVDGAVAILADKTTMDLAVRVSGQFARSEIIDIGELPEEFRKTERDWERYEGCIDLVGCGSGDGELTEWIVWLQKLIEHGKKDGLRLLGVTQGLESHYNAAVRMSGAERAGLYRMLQSEYGRLSSRHMDADPSCGEAATALQIASEFATDSPDAEVCYRNGIRYRAFLAEWQEDAGGEPIVFPEGHVLWITGGTRGIGYVCAEHFVRRYGVKKLVLTGREALPPREEWSSGERHSSSVAQKIRAIQALETLGAEVEVLSADLTDEQTLRSHIEAVNRTMGPVGGVIHCAGLIDPDHPAFIRKSVSGIRRVQEPKISGLNALYRSMRNEPLAFFVLFSSVSSIVPVLASGQSDYCMANAYMDYFAEAEAGSCRMVSIQWPSWKETGMGETKSKVYGRTGLLSITNEEGLRLLDRILSSMTGPAVLLPAVVNPDLWNPADLLRHEERKLPLAAGSRLPAEHASAPPVAAGNLSASTQAWLMELLAEELKIDSARLEPDTAFQDYGVDSVMLAQLLRRINRQLDEELEPTVLFEYPSVESLAAWLVRTYPAKLAQFPELSGNERPDVAAADARPNGRTEIAERRMPERKRNGADVSDIAVIGMSCRFPGADSPEEYWQVLAEGRSAIGPVPYDRWGYESNFYAGLLHDIGSYDPAYFLIPEADAAAMDPQALLVLEESLKLLCNAGYSAQEIKGKRVGVYLGARSRHQPEGASLQMARNPIVAVGQNYLAANISQYFDLRGPSVVVDTACSSALVGMQMAVQALQAGDVDAAIVGGASLLTTDESHRIFEQREILPPGRHFHLFDRRAEGAVLGEGAGMVLLKTVERALADGDRIHAVMKGLAINNDGRTAGPAAPNIQAQKEVLQAALLKSGRKPEHISYIETNGSGTAVTDLLELKAIQAVYRTSGTSPLGLGSMKPNIGHPLCAEGIASFLKVVLMLQHKRFVPFLSGQEPMNHYDMNHGPFYFCRECTDWTETPRIAAINCFADGGTNAHAILEEWADSDGERTLRSPLPLPSLHKKRIWGGGAKSEQAREMVWETFG